VEFTNVLEVISRISKKSIAITQMGPSYYALILPFITTIFLFVLGSNWLESSSLKLIEIPSGELAAPTNDINTTAALAILTSLTYFSAGFSIKGIDILNAMFNHRPSYYQLTLLKILLNQYL
jgi:F-type H+-transporting ATPase subunit a